MVGRSWDSASHWTRQPGTQLLRLYKVGLAFGRVDEVPACALGRSASKAWKLRLRNALEFHSILYV